MNERERTEKRERERGSEKKVESLNRPECVQKHSNEMQQRVEKELGMEMSTRRTNGDEKQAVEKRKLGEEPLSEKIEDF